MSTATTATKMNTKQTYVKQTASTDIPNTSSPRAFIHFSTFNRQRTKLLQFRYTHTYVYMRMANDTHSYVNKKKNGSRCNESHDDKKKQIDTPTIKNVVMCACCAWTQYGTYL